MTRLRRRLGPRLLPILQTATAAVLAYWLADALLDDPRPVFASIAAVICLGASYGQRRQRAVQLVGGVVLGITIADLIIQLIGAGPLQLGVMVLLAMSAAVLLGGGELLVVESAVSAMLLVALAPEADPGYSPNRILEALIGGGVGLVVASLFFPPDPRIMVDRAMQGVIGGLGRALQRVSAALQERDADEASRALEAARALDGHMAALYDALVTARETARFSPPRRGGRDRLEPYERSVAQVDFAVRDTRVLARHGLRYLRGRSAGLQEELPRAVGELAEAVWALGGAYETPSQAIEARRLALEAAGRAAAALEHDPSLSEVVAQVRSTAVDLVRAAELIGEAPDPDVDRSTKELLIVDPT